MRVDDWRLSPRLAKPKISMTDTAWFRLSSVERKAVVNLGVLEKGGTIKIPRLRASKFVELFFDQN